MTVDISVIVPCFNQSAYVGQAVRSALAQTFEALEVIVVDDGSNDDPAAALGPLLDDPRVTFIRQQNQGVAVARNVAIARSRGRLLHFLDADDWIAPEMLGTLTRVMIDRSKLGMAYCDITHVDAAGLQLDDYSVGAMREQVDGNLLPSLLVGGYFPPVAVLVSREAIERVGGFDGALGGCCDWDVWSQIASLGYEAAYVDRKLAFYRIHAGSMSRDTTHMSETMRMALRKLIHLHPDQAADSIDRLIHDNASLFKKAQVSAAEAQRLAGEMNGQQRQLDSLQASKSWFEAQVASHAQALEATQTALQEAHAGYARLDEAIRWHAAQNESLARALAGSVTELDASKQLARDLKRELDVGRQWLSQAMQRLRGSPPVDRLGTTQPATSVPGVASNDVVMHDVLPLMSDADRRHFERYVAFIETLDASGRFRFFNTLKLLPRLPRTHEDPT